MKRSMLILLALSTVLLSACSRHARSIGIIGGADGPTAIMVSEKDKDADKKPLRMMKVDDKLYYDSGLVSETTSRCGTLDGELTQARLAYEIPQNNNECNFEGAEGYQNATSITKEVPINGEWVIFKLYDESKNVAQYDMKDLKYCFYLKGRTPNAEKDAEIITLTDNKNCTFDDFINMFSSYYNHDGKDYKFTFQSYGVNDKWGLSLSSKNVTSKGMTILFEQFGGKPTGELQTGEWFSLEVNKNDKWVALETNPIIDYAWHAIAYEIKKNDITELDIDWKWLYGELPPGYYRIKKEVTDFRAAGDFDKEIYQQCFVID